MSLLASPIQLVQTRPEKALPKRRHDRAHSNGGSFCNPLPPRRVGRRRHCLAPYCPCWVADPVGLDASDFDSLGRHMCGAGRTRRALFRGARHTACASEPAASTNSDSEGSEASFGVALFPPATPTPINRTKLVLLERNEEPISFTFPFVVPSTARPHTPPRQPKLRPTSPPPLRSRAYYYDSDC